MNSTMISRRSLLASAGLLAAGGTLAQTPSNKITTLVLSVPPGGAVDVLGRELSTLMGKALGTTIVVESKAGASGMLAAQAVARAPADGTTLLLTHSTPILYMPHLFPKIAYDVTRDLSFVTQICDADLALVVNKDVPVKTLPEFLKWAMANRGKVSYGSYSTGSAGHLLSEYLSLSRKLDMTHVPYKGEGPMLQDIMGGHISWGLSIYGSAAPYITSGRMNALAITGPQRLPQMPDTPTFAEAGLADEEFRIMGEAAQARRRTPPPSGHQRRLPPPRGGRNCVVRPPCIRQRRRPRWTQHSDPPLLARSGQRPGPLPFYPSRNLE